MKAKLILIMFLMAFVVPVPGFQRARAASIEAYDTDSGTPLYVSFGTIDASTDYHLCPSAAINAILAWDADPGSWEITVYYDSEGDQVQISSGDPNEGALLSVAIGFELDNAGAAANPPTDVTYDDDATYRVIRLGSVSKLVLADGTSVIPPGEPNEGERMFEDIGSRPFVLAVSTKDGAAFNGAYVGTFTFDLDTGL